MSKTNRFKAFLFFIQGASLVAVGLCEAGHFPVPALCPWILIVNGGIVTLQAKMSLGVKQEQE